MTNDKFKPTFKQPFIPKTETKIVLDWSQPVKKSNLSVSARSKVINRSGSGYLSSWADADISEAIGYGPCKTCDKGESSPIEFKMACPGKDCEDRTEGYWHHNKDGCRKSRMLITSWGNLSCGGCGIKRSMANWEFSCSEHEGQYRSMNQDSWEKSMGYALFMKNVNQATRDLNVYVTNHPEKFGFPKNE